MSISKSYYEGQIKGVKVNGESAPRVKISHEDGGTHWLAVNEDSAPILIEWLTKNFAPRVETTPVNTQLLEALVVCSKSLATYGSHPLIEMEVKAAIKNAMV